MIRSYPNSNHQIEPELMNIVLKNAQINYYLTCKWSSGILDESLCLLAPRKDVGNLAVIAESDELQHCHQIMKLLCPWSYEDFYVNGMRYYIKKSGRYIRIHGFEN